MSEKVNIINDVVSAFAGIELIQPFGLQENEFLGKIEISVDGAKLPFDVKINVQYPFRFHDTETIKFFNANLIEYDHVMKDGHVCIHTTHSSDLIKKLNYDLSSLQHWIRRYYLKKENDEHYEHIIVPYTEFRNAHYNFLFTDTAHKFAEGEFGYCKYSQLPFEGEQNGKKLYTYLLQSFQTNNKEEGECEWSKEYKNTNKPRHGDAVYVFTGNPPVKNKRFVIDRWEELNALVKPIFKDFLVKVKNQLPTNLSTPLPLFIGYTIPSGEVHWQCALIDLKDFPLTSVKFNAGLLGGAFTSKNIIWAPTKNCSYRYFFGRGALDAKLAKKSILIVGIGAVGSQLATTFVRGGCTDIGLVDYDLKESENVCRAEYPFVTGITTKIFDLSRTLASISPFVELHPSEWFTDMLKYAAGHGKDLEARIRSELDQYDYIFDCSTDDDIAYILDSIESKAQIFNLSITNHAKELVCITKPNLYERMNDMYGLIEQEANDLYNPTGCWSPTFKASYNDVSLLVQYAIQHINMCISKGHEVRNFVVEKKVTEKVELIIKEF